MRSKYFATGFCVLALLASSSSHAADTDPRTASLQSMIDAIPDGAIAFRALPPGALHLPGEEGLPVTPGVLHIQSGAVCLLGRGDALMLASLEVFDKGRGVGCKYRLQHGYMELFAMRLDKETIETFRSENIGGFEKQNPGARRIQDPVAATADGETPPLTRAYQQTAPDGERVTAIWVGQAGDWAISVYATSSLESHAESEPFGAIAWMVGADGVLGKLK